jgi:hypothetical protein
MVFYMVVIYWLWKNTQEGMSHLKIAAIQTVQCFCDHQFCSKIPNIREWNIPYVRTVTDIWLNLVLQIVITCTFAMHIVCATHNNCRCQQFTNPPSSTSVIMLLLTEQWIVLYCIVLYCIVLCSFICLQFLFFQLLKFRLLLTV